MDILVEEPGPRLHLQQQLGQVDWRQHPRDQCTQLGQRGWFPDRLQPLDRQPHPPLGSGRHDPDAGIGSGRLEPLSQGLPRGVQRGGQLGQVLVDWFGQAEAGQNLAADSAPGGAVEQLCPGIGPPHGRSREHVAAAKCPVQLLQHAQHVGVTVDRTRGQVGVGEHRPPPRRHHHILGDVGSGQRPDRRPAPGKVGQPAHLPQQVLARGSGLQWQRLGQQLQEWPDHAVLGGQRLPHRGLTRVVVRDQLVHQGRGRGDLFTRGDLLNNRPRRRDIKLSGGMGSRLVECGQQRPRRTGQRHRGLLQARHPRQPLRGRRTSRRADQPGRHQHVEQVQSVVDRRCLQRLSGGQQRGGPSRLGQQLDSRRLRGQPVPRQRDKTARRHRRRHRGARTHAQHVRDPVQGGGHRLPRRPGRGPAQPLQLGEPLPIHDLQQAQQPPRHLRIRTRRGLGEGPVHPVCGILSHTRDQPRQHARSRQQHPLPAQPRHRLIEQRQLALGMCPRAAGHELPQSGRRTGIGEVPKPVQVPDLPPMLVLGR